MTVLDALVAALKKASEYNKADQTPPACVLWTDKDRQWEPLVARLRESLPILTLGEYAPESRIGPAIWLRCMIARTMDGVDYWPIGETPILYLPGVSRQDLRAIEECPRLLQPLAELQYRGVFFSQKNAKDWTVNAFLVSNDGGLGVAVGSDTATREAMLRALLPLSLETVTALQKEAPLTAGKFNGLLNPEPVRNLLLFLDDSKGQREARDPLAWSAFRAVCKEQFGYDPESDGELTGARLLGDRQGEWHAVWNRFAEAPAKYPNLPGLLRRARPKGDGGLFHDRSSWPQDNETAEAELRTGLQALAGIIPADARQQIYKLEAIHAERRNWVWAELGQSPLAYSLLALVTLAKTSETALGGKTPDDVAHAYTSGGWRVDAAALDALALVDKADDVSSVKTAVESLYRPWLRDAADAFQIAVKGHPLPAPSPPGAAEPPKAGRCHLFADGLRYDCSQKLADVLTGMGFTVKSDWAYCALPAVTPTAKPAVTPVASLLGAGAELTPRVLSDSASVTAEIVRRELIKTGYEVLLGDDTGTGSTGGWTELGNIDAFGHAQGWRLAHRIAEEVESIARRIRSLLESGWTEVKIVTDHGWLLLPGGLPKAELPEHLTVIRKGRCARLTPDATTNLPTVPWRWDANVRIAVAPGISCFTAGKEYEHGGLSPQECITPVLTVRGALPAGPVATIKNTRWRGLSCKIQVEGAVPGTLVDIRSKPADAQTSVAAAPKPVNSEGQATIMVPDDSLEGQAAMVVLLGSDGSVLAQLPTLIGDSN